MYDNENTSKDEVEAAKAELNAVIQNLKPVENKVADADKYDVYRFYKKDFGYAKITTVTAVSYTDSKSTAGKASGYEIYRATNKKGTYYYKVRAYKSVGKKKIYTDYSKAVKVKVK